MPGITVVGSINADLVARVPRHPQPGETLLGSGGIVTAGGKGANQAVAAALQGAPVHFIGAIGKDPYRVPALQFLQSSGVNLDGVQDVDSPTGLAIITVAENGENSIVVIPGANQNVTAEYVRTQAEALQSADIVLLQGEIPRAALEESIRIAHKAGTRIVINLAPVIELDPDLLRLADPLIVNEHEAGLVLAQLGIPATENPAQALRDAGFSSVILTLGEAGCIVAAEKFTAIPAHNVPVVDTTGAGDAFAGACVAALLHDDSLIAAATFATKVSALAVQKAGAQAAYPDALEYPCA